MSNDPQTGIDGNLERKQRRPAAVTGLLLLVLMLAFGLRLYGLDSSSFWLDEIFTATAAQMDLPSILRFHLVEAGNPPLTSIITHAVFACLGQSEFVARLPSALFGSVSILLVYEVGKLLWTRKVGIMAALLMAVNAHHVQYSQEARHYALMVFLALLSLVFLVRALKGDRRGPWLGFVLCTTLGLYNHYFALLFLPAEVLFGATVIAERWFAERSGTNQPKAPHQSGQPPSAAKQALRLAISLLLVGISYLPWISTLQSQFPRQLQSPGLGITLANLRLSVDFLHSALIAQFGATGPLLALWIILVLWGMWTSGRKQMILALAWLLAPFLFLAMVQPRHPARERYVIYTLPLLLLVASRGLVSFARLLTKVLDRVMRDKKPRSVVIQVSAVLLLGALSTAPFRYYPTWRKEDWRSATAYLLDNARGTDVIIADGQGYGPGADAGRTVDGLTYYFSLAGENATMFEAQSGLASGLDEVTDHGATAWGVLWHHADLANLEQVDPNLEVVEFPRVAVIRPLAPQGDLLADTRSLLETLILLQPGPSGRIDLHLALAEMYLAAGNPADALGQADLAATAARLHQSEVGPDPYLADAYSQVGTILEQLERPHEALAAYEEAVLNDPTEDRAHLGIGNIRLHLHEPVLAIAAYRHAVDIGPTKANEYFLLGEAYLQVGELQEAVAAYQEALGIRPDHPQARRRLDLLSSAFDEDIPSPLVRSLGFEVGLLGYGVDSPTARAGTTVEASLWWLALARMDKDYTAFIHLTDEEGRLWAQDDQTLEDNGHLTSTWTPATAVKQTFHAHLSPDLPSGVYTFSVGVYYWETGERLTVWEEDGQGSPANTIPLGTIAITQ